MAMGNTFFKLEKPTAEDLIKRGNELGHLELL